MHETHTFTDLHHIQFTETFSENEIIVDDALEQFAAADPKRTQRTRVCVCVSSID